MFPVIISNIKPELLKNKNNKNVNQDISKKYRSIPILKIRYVPYMTIGKEWKICGRKTTLETERAVIKM